MGSTARIKAMWKKNETIKNDIINTDKLKHSDFQKITSTNAEAAKVYLDSERLVSNNTNEELYETLKSKKKLVLVYQMGKVGSASIKTKLKEYDDLAVYHIHRLNKKTNDLMIKMHLNNCNVELALQERKWKEISTFLQSEKPNLYIITAIRDPIARNISAFFQNYDFKQQKESDVSSLVYKFMNEYPHQLPLKWFDEQIKEVFGIDVLNYPFDRKRGWNTITYRNIKCLLMTAETRDADKITAINSFLQINIGQLARTNVGEQKNYASLYKKFKKRVVFSQDYLRNILQNPVIEHFYTPDQINMFLDEWSSKIY
jgi:endo-alpha-1,4-polygalactosaminidase (GH114 family)